MRLTIALGGNAILKPGQNGNAVEQLSNVYESWEQIGELAAEGYVGPSRGNKARRVMIDQIPLEEFDIPEEAAPDSELY